MAFKKAGSEASEPDVAKFKVFYNINTYCYHKLPRIIFYSSLVLHYRKVRLMVRMAVKANLIGAVIRTVRARVVTMKANIKIFVNVLSKSDFLIYKRINEKSNCN